MSERLPLFVDPEFVSPPIPPVLSPAPTGASAATGTATSTRRSAPTRAAAGIANVGDAEPDAAPLVSPPTDSELVWYLGPQRRWVQVITLVAFGLAAISLTEFGISSPFLWPILIVVALTVLASLLSIVTGFSSRRMNERTHFDLVDSWRNTTDYADYPSIDVFLPSCGEDLAVLRNTFTHVSRMTWHGTIDVWVMDDADKHEVEELAAEFGFHYRVRENRGYMKKAGNLAAAFGVTAGDFIVIFDADFCPRPDFLSHTIPYLDDPKIAIVQTPQFFETRGENMNWIERTAGSTQELFYRWIQPSRDRLGAPICVGTCAVYRRSALDKAGGFVQIEHSEDVFTGLQLTRSGFRLRYVPIIVSKGLCPTDLSGFLNQQYRWANGSLTLMKSGKATHKPLSFRQRLCFWSGFLYYVSTAVNVFVLHVPGIIMATWYASDVRAAHFVPFLAGAWVYFVLLPRMSKSQWRFEVMRIQMAYSLAHALAVVHKLTGRSAGWVATGAVGKSSSLSRTIAKMGIVLIVVTLGWSWVALGHDIATFGIKQFWPMALFIVGYTYLGLPLLVEFVKILRPQKAEATPVLSLVPEPDRELETKTTIAPVTPIQVARGSALGYSFDTREADLREADLREVGE